MGGALVATIRRHEILHQVIGSDAEELHFRCQQISDYRSAGNLDHHPQLDIGFEGFATGAQLFHGLFQKAFGMKQLFPSRDHREHQLQIAVDGGPEDGAELDLENLGMAKAKTDGATSEERILLFTDVEALRGLVPADIKSADNDAVRSDAFGDLPIDGVLFLFIGRCGAVKIEEFRPV
jgi:hypothetical protein